LLPFGQGLLFARAPLFEMGIKGCDLIEKMLSGSKPRPMLRLILQALLDGNGCLRHAHTPFFTSMYLWMVSFLFYSFSTGKKQ
jgi:hypothetical protein